MLRPSYLGEKKISDPINVQSPHESNGAYNFFYSKNIKPKKTRKKYNPSSFLSTPSVKRECIIDCFLPTLDKNKFKNLKVCKISIFSRHSCGKAALGMCAHSHQFGD